MAFGLAEDVANSFHLENPEGGLQYSSEGVRWVLKGSPKGSIHHDTSKAFPISCFRPLDAVLSSVQCPVGYVERGGGALPPVSGLTVQRIICC